MSTRGSEQTQKKGAVDVNWRHDDGKNVGMGRQLTNLRRKWENLHSWIWNLDQFRSN